MAFNSNESDEKKMKKRVIHWFRYDLRLADNPALHEASGFDEVLPIYILTPETISGLGQASNIWLHHSLKKLNESTGFKIAFYKGNPKEIITEIIQSEKIHKIFWNKIFEPYQLANDEKLVAELDKMDISWESFNGSLLWEPSSILKNDKTPYKVFTPYYRKGCLFSGIPREPLISQKRINWASCRSKLKLDDLRLLPNHDWKNKIESHWIMGESAANERLEEFIGNNIKNYKSGRNYPSKPYVSRLSPHIHFGELSPNQVWYSVRSLGQNKNVDHFCSELGWREFSHYLIHHFPDMLSKNLNRKFDSFPWDNNEDLIRSWELGQTGYPIVDAGMKELWETGYIHNRVRMIVGSFLVKNLLTHWNYGRDWFNDCLVDADLANNTASWQWVAGTGADAAPYFRIFNPVKQGRDFDADGEYTKKYLPQLSSMPQKYLFNPWEAPKGILHDAGIKLGENYPHPIVDLKESRERALFAFSQIK